MYGQTNRQATLRARAGLIAGRPRSPTGSRRSSKIVIAANSTTAATPAGRGNEPAEAVLRGLVPLGDEGAERRHAEPGVRRGEDGQPARSGRQKRWYRPAQRPRQPETEQQVVDLDIRRQADECPAGQCIPDFHHRTTRAIELQPSRAARYCSIVAAGPYGLTWWFPVSRDGRADDRICQPQIDGRGHVRVDAERSEPPVGRVVQRVGRADRREQRQHEDSARCRAQDEPDRTMRAAPPDTHNRRNFSVVWSATQPQ